MDLLDWETFLIAFILAGGNVSWSGNRKGQGDYIISKEKFRNSILIFYLNENGTFHIFSRK